jgi:hypothetical protein
MPTITGLPDATTPIAGTVTVPVVQGGITKEATVASLRDTPEPFTMTAQATGSVPAAAAGTTKFFARSYAGRVMPEFIGETGVDCFVQPALFNNAVFMVAPASGTTFASAQTVFGGAVTTISGTVSNPAITAGTVQSTMRRTRYATSATANNAGGLRSTDPLVLRGNAANTGGFFAFFRFSQTLATFGHQAFIGLYGAVTTMAAGGPANMVDMIGIGYGTADAVATGWRLFMNDGSGTATSINLTGAPRDTETVLDLTLYAPSNGSGITVRVYNQSTQSVVLDNVTYTTDIPTNTVPLYAHVQVRNGSIASSHSVDLARIYVESDL